MHSEKKSPNPNARVEESFCLVAGQGNEGKSGLFGAPLDYSTLLAARDVLRARLRNQTEANFGGRLDVEMAKTRHWLRNVNEQIAVHQQMAFRAVVEAFPIETKVTEPQEGWCQDFDAEGPQEGQVA